MFKRVLQSKAGRRRKLSYRVVSVLCCATAFGLLSPRMQAVDAPIPPTFFGMHIARSTVQEWPNAPIGALGKKSGTAWRWLQPEPETYRWNGLDRWVGAAESHHVPAMYTFGQPSRWASTDPERSCGKNKDFNDKGAPIECSAPPKLEAWRSYVTAVVTRYKGRIKFYELWNEPNNPHHWSGSYKDMVVLAREAYRIIHSIDPGAVVITPATGAGRVGGPHPRPAATSLDQARWMDEYFQAGGGEYADAVSFHAYPRYDTCSDTLACAGSSLVEHVDRVRAIMAHHGLSSKPLYVTEGGWRQEEDLPDPDQQVAFLGRWFLILAGKGIAGAYWYAWDAWGTLWDRENGLRPPGQAYEQIYRWLEGASISPCKASGKIWTCSITRGNGYQALAVWSSSGNVAYTPGREFKQYRDLREKTVLLEGPIQVGLTPILLESRGR